MDGSIYSPDQRDEWMERLVLAIAVGIAVFAARPYAGSWNDGSRLATVETLVDQHTWIIDHSTFVQVPAARDSITSLPYDPAEPALLKHGTQDKLFIEGHYYSDKSPVPALLMAGCYRVWQGATGWTACAQPARFCRAMTLISSGLAYVLAVLCIYRLGRPLRLSGSLRLALTGSFALGTVALPYVQHVNNHILLLGVTAALMLGVAWLFEELRLGCVSWRRFAGLGALAGLGYTIDLGAGPMILLCTALLILNVSRLRLSTTPQAARCERVTALSPCLIFGLAALPWLVLHHALNYAIGGSFKPANANPAYFDWPGSPFDVRNLTGSWIHNGPLSFLLYAASMLAGKRGFLGHNLPLFLTMPALAILLHHHREKCRNVLWAAGCCFGTWILYAATSNNSSGQCCSIRWFVPLLAPGYYILAIFLQRYPEYRRDFVILSVWGLLLVVFMREGPWIQHMVRFFWPIQAAALSTWALCHYLRNRITLGRCLESPTKPAE
ncbi:MAG TPA: hypothetical protein VN688_05335 [Gemmataceae bacterium]|nr:hypothetical protein [Gemmataceae bacterium]